MLNLTQQAIEKFDNQHDFERMCADILNQLGYSKVTPIAPRGGSDGGKDITYTSYDGKSRGLACCTVRKDTRKKFTEDFYQRSKDDYEEYYFFTNQYTTHDEKMEFKRYCLEELNADLTVIDQEALRSLLDTAMQSVRDSYMQNLPKNTSQNGYVEFKLSHIQILYLKLLDKSDDKRLSITGTMGGDIVQCFGRVVDAGDIQKEIDTYDTQEIVAELNELADAGIFDRKYGRHSLSLVLAKSGYSAIRQIKESDSSDEP